MGIVKSRLKWNSIDSDERNYIERCRMRSQEEKQETIEESEDLLFLNKKPLRFLKNLDFDLNPTR